MIPWLLVPLGGAVGALARYAADRAVTGIIGPTVMGTLFVNVTGSFLLGLFLAMADSKFTWPTELRMLIAVGFLGSYTTFSTVTVASVQLAEEGAVIRATANILGSMALGLLAAFLGLLAGRAV